MNELREEANQFVSNYANENQNNFSLYDLEDNMREQLRDFQNEYRSDFDENVYNWIE